MVSWLCPGCCRILARDETHSYWLTVWNKACPVLCLYTHLYVFLTKTTWHVDSGTCSYMLSQFSCCACVYRDDIGIPLCHFVRCRRHSNHSVFSVHKSKVQTLLFLCFLFLFFAMLFCSLSLFLFLFLSLCPFCWLADDLYLMNTTKWLWLKKVF